MLLTRADPGFFKWEGVRLVFLDSESMAHAPKMVQFENMIPCGLKLLLEKY